jgi:hypothetical protein
MTTMHTPANLPQLLLMELMRRLIASQQAQQEAAMPRTIGPAPVPPRPLVFPNDRGPAPVSPPYITTLPNPGTGHGRGSMPRHLDLLGARKDELAHGITGAPVPPPPLLPIVPPGGAPAVQPPQPPLRVIGTPPPGEHARRGITTLPNPGTGHGRTFEDYLNEWAAERAFWRDR